MTPEAWARNPVCTIRFCGFESDTLTLQRCGWQFAALQDPGQLTIKLSIKHPQGWYGLTDSVSYGHMLATLRGRDGALLARDHRALAFNVVAFNSNIRVMYTHMLQTCANWSAVDALPAAVAQSFSDRGLHELVPFVPINHEAQQIIVAPESVPRVLDLLLACQAPAAQARRTGDQLREWRDAAKIQAQVLVA